MKNDYTIKEYSISKIKGAVVESINMVTIRTSTEEEALKLAQEILYKIPKDKVCKLETSKT